MAMHRVVCNSSPLINLFNVQQLSLLEALYGTVLIPEAVRQEVCERRKHHERTETLQRLIDRGILEVRGVQNRHLVQAFQKDLDYGESEVLSLAVEVGADLVIIDEIDGRRIAELHNLQKIGFIARKRQKPTTSRRRRCAAAFRTCAPLTASQG